MPEACPPPAEAGATPPGRQSATGPRESLSGTQALRRDALTMPEVLAQSVATMAPSAAMSLLPLLVFTSAGNGTWLSFVCAVLLMLCVSACAAQLARRYSSAGSLYTWVGRSLGPGFGHAAGWGLLLGYLCAGMAGALGVGIFGTDLLTRCGLVVSGAGAWVVLVVVGFVPAVGMAILGAVLSTRASLVLEIISVTIILALCAGVWVHNGGVIDLQQITLKGASPGGILVGVVLAIYSMSGFESAGSFGFESRHPFRNVPRAILWSCLIVGMFYLVVVYTQVFGFRGVPGGLATSQAPLADLAHRIGLDPLAYLVDIGILCSIFAGVTSVINASARIVVTMSEDGIAPKVLAHIHQRFRTPHLAILAVSLPVLAVPVSVVLASRSPVDAVGWMASVATYGLMFSYALVSLAAPVHLGRIGRPSLPTWVLGGIGFLTMIAVFYASWLPQTIPGGLFPPLTGVNACLPYVFLGWTVAGIAWYLVLRARNPEAARRLGQRFDSLPGQAPVAGRD